MDIETSEFKGDLKELSKILQKKLKRKINVHNKMLRIENNLSTSTVRDALKRSLHKIDPRSYHVISKSGFLKIKRIKSHSHEIKKDKSTPPSAPQSLPYFFPR